MNSYIMHLTAQDDRRTIHEAFAHTFGFPEFYGNNLDALFDVLTSLSEETHLLLLIRDLSQIGTNSYLLRTLSTLDWASSENPCFTHQIGDDPVSDLDPESFFAPHNDY